MKNIITILYAMVVCCFLSNVTLAQGTIGEYPGAGVGFDSGCGYADAGNNDPGVSDAGLTGNVCGSAFDVSFGTWTETATGFDISGFELNNYDIDEEAVYGIRLFYGPQDNCCTICLDAVLDLTQNNNPNPAPCGTFGPQADLGSFGIPIPANYGASVFGEDILPYTEMCPNTEYFAIYQFILATETGNLDDPDGNGCALDDALITNAGTQTTVQTLVAPGTRDSFVINSATFTPVAAADCAATDVLFDFSIDVSSGCTIPIGPCSKGLEVELRASIVCGDGSTLDLNTGPLINDPTACIVGVAGTNELAGQISLGTAADICAIFDCDPNASLEVYARHTFCEADDIVGDGSGIDEALTTVSLASILADFDAAACCMVQPVVCSSTYDYTAPAAVCNGAAIDFTVDAACDVSLNTIDFGGGTMVDPSLDLDFYIYAPGGAAGMAPAGYTVIPADIDGGATGNADIIYLGTAGAATTVGNGCGDFQFAAGTLLNGTCDTITVSFFTVPYSYDFDTDGDGTFGAYLADGNADACPIIQTDVVINPIFEVIEDVTIGCDPIAAVFAGDGMGGVFDTDGDGAITFADACATEQLMPTADCTDGATLDYDFTIDDVDGTCSGDLTGTLTCVCPVDAACDPYNAVVVAPFCDGYQICLGYTDDLGLDPTGGSVTVSEGSGLTATVIDDGITVVTFDADGDGVDDSSGFCYTVALTNETCDPVPYTPLVTATCPDGSPATYVNGATLTDYDYLAGIFGVAGGTAAYPALVGLITAPVCPTLPDGSDAVAGNVEVFPADAMGDPIAGAAACTAVAGDTPACDTTGGDAATVVQFNPISDPLLTAVLNIPLDTLDYFCGLDGVADLSFTCGPCDGTSACAGDPDYTAPTEVCSAVDADGDGNLDGNYVLSPGAGCTNPVSTAFPGDDRYDYFITLYIDPVTGAPGPAPAGYDPVTATNTFNVDLADVLGGTLGSFIGFANGTQCAADVPLVLTNPTCEIASFSFFIVPVDYDSDLDGDMMFGDVLDDADPNYCPPIRLDVDIYPILTASVVDDGTTCGTAQIDLLAEDGTTVCDSQTLACAADGDVLNADFSGDFADPAGCSTLTASTTCMGCGMMTVCEIEVVISNIVCNDGGTPEVGDDDTFTFDYTVNDIGGTGTTWSSDQGDAGVAYGTTVAGTANANSTFTINVNDDGDVACVATASEILGDCVQPAIPTLSQWGLMSLALLLMIFGALKLGTATVTNLKTRSN